MELAALDPQRPAQAWAHAELERRVGALIRLGVVHAADYARARVRVRYDATPDGAPVLTGWLAWLCARAGPDRAWWAPEVGEQVVVLSPGGELAQAVVLGALYQAAHPANADRADITRVDWADGSWVEHDRASGDIRMFATGDIHIEAQGRMWLKATRIDQN